MDAALAVELDPAIFQGNLEALTAALPRSAETIAAAPVPDSLHLLRARDGSVTLAQSDQAGRFRWLGRTSMPEVRAEALVECFEPGSGNTLLCGIGQGAVARRLLESLSPHQAVVVIEETTWVAAAVLRLHDFAQAISSSRLVILTGRDPWDQCRCFLEERPGFLAPERILSWPWFDPETISRVSDRLASVQAAARSRSSRSSATRGQADPSIEVRARPGLVVVSTVPTASVHRLSRRIAAGAAELGIPVERFVLDDPLRVHPHAVQRRLEAFSPTWCLLIDTPPSALPYPLPPGRHIFLSAGAEPLPEPTLRALGPDILVALPTERQCRQALDRGLAESRVLLTPPAALPGLADRRRRRGHRMIVAEDGVDVSADAAGLHLASHHAIWDVATQIITARVDDYRDEEAESILQQAQKQLGIQLDSAEVRKGLASRIRHVLGPGLVKRLFLQALVEADVKFDLYGTGWEDDPSLAPCLKGPWPAVERDPKLMPPGCLFLSLRTSGELRAEMLDALAAGFAVLVRRHPRDESKDGLAGVLRPDRHVLCFGSRAELVAFAAQSLGDPEAFFAATGSAAEHIKENHTWTARLRTILDV